jgi:hypothetical protein
VPAAAGNLKGKKTENRLMIPTETLSPTIARALGVVPKVDPFRPSFLNWVLDETDRLLATVSMESSREERFRVQNRIADLNAAAYSYGQWLQANAPG